MAKKACTGFSLKSPEKTIKSGFLHGFHETDPAV